MVLQALFVSEDDAAVGVLTSVFSGFGVRVLRSAYPNGVFALPEQKPDALIVDFDDLEQAISIVKKIGAASLSPVPIIIALVEDRRLIRNIFAAGANFILYKPVSDGPAIGTLRAAISLIRRERRRRFRVPIQAPVKLSLSDGTDKDGILLDLSEGGMDILTPEPIPTSTKLIARINLPDMIDVVELTGEIAWGNPNGQSGIRFSNLSEHLHHELVRWVGTHAEDLPHEEPIANCKLSDLSPGACYVETNSPFPERSAVSLRVRVEKMEVKADGKVQVMHPGFGMGIEFSPAANPHKATIQNLLNLLTSVPGAVPELEVAPLALVSNNGFHDSAQTDSDPLVYLLRNHEYLDEEQFHQELRSQRTKQEMAHAYTPRD